MTPFTVFNVKTGEITATGTCAESMLSSQTRGRNEAVLPAASDAANDCVDDGKVVAKQPMSPQVHGSRLSGLPIPCTLTIEGQTYAVADGCAELAFNLPGEYRVEIRAPKLLPFGMVVRV